MESLPIILRETAGPISAETQSLDAGGDLLILVTHSADLGLNLRSVYGVGGPGGEIVVMDMWRFRGVSASPTVRHLAEAPDDPLWEAIATDDRSRCLYEHLTRYIEVADAEGFALGVDGIDAAVRQLQTAESL